MNLVRGSRINPKLSAWAQVNGLFDFNRRPLAPPGCRVLVHEKPQNRTTWSPHALDGWYVGPALESYRCYRIWIWDTRTTRICDTVSWFPTKVRMPETSYADTISASLQDIAHALKAPSPRAPVAPLLPSYQNALRQLLETLAPLATAPTENPPVDSCDTPPLLRVALPTPATTPVFLPPAVPVVTPASLRVPTPVAITPVHPLAQPLSYTNATGPLGRRRRTTQRRNTKGRLLTAITSPCHDAEIHYCLHGSAINPDTGKSAEYRELLKSSASPLWAAANGNEIGRLFQGLGKLSDMPSGSNCCYFIPKHKIPPGKKPTYIRIVCADRPEKENPHRVRWTAGGDKITYLGNVSTKTADITTAKCLFNSVLSTPAARFMTLDISDFYLESHMSPLQYEYLRIPIWMIPSHIQVLYNLQPQIIDGHVYAEIRRGMYGLPQAGKLANDQLQTFLAPHGYIPCSLTPGLWRDMNSDLMFTLVVDDFGVRYSNRAHADKLLTILSQKYRVKADWTGSRYIGLSLDWDYTARTLDLSMPAYIERALQRFNHPKPTRPQNAPHEWVAPTYGARQQYATQDLSPAIDLADKKRVQEVLGTLLYYARAIDSTMLAAIGTLATQQSSPTVATMKAITHLLNYCATHPNATLRYVASDMMLHVESDASYLSETKGRSRAAGIHFLTQRPATTGNTINVSPPPNGALYVHCHILTEVLSSAAEAELAALFHNGKEACAIRTLLQELGHPQPATPIITDNSTASGIVNDTVKQRRSKAMDMRFYWIRDRVRQGQFLVYWKKGSLNRADYFTKHHSPRHHQTMRSHYLHDPSHNSYAILDDDATPPKLPMPITTTEYTGGEGVLKPTSLPRHGRSADAGLSSRQIQSFRFSRSHHILATQIVTMSLLCQLEGISA